MIWPAIPVAILVGLGAFAGYLWGGPRDRLADWATPARLLVLSYLLFDGIGAVALAFTGESSGGAWLIGAGAAAMALGILVGHRILGPAVPIPAGMIVGPARLPIAVALAGIGLLAYAGLALEHGIPLLSGDAQAVRAGWSGLPLDLFRWLVPPAALLTLGIALATGARRAWLATVGLIVAIVVLEVAAASRTLPFELGLGALLIAWWAGRRFRLGTWIVLIGLAGLIFVGVLFARVAPEGGFTGPLDALAFAFNRSVGRVVLIQPRTVEAAIATFPDEMPYLGGASYGRWVSRLNGEAPPEALGTTLFRILFPDEPPGGFAAPGILAEGYANFGPLFAIGLMAGLGVLAAVGDRWIGGSPGDAATRALAALLTVALLRTYATSLNGFLLTCAAAVGWWLLVGAPWPRPWEGLRMASRTGSATD